MKADAKKTLIFILVAGMAVLVAWEPWRPAPLETSAPADVGTKLFPDFTNALAAKSLEIVKFNEQTAAIGDFKVAQTGGVWSIPSHSNYPADAKEHMADAATSLMDLKILNLASDRPGDQKEYGVITPDPAKLRVGMTGVGTRVTVRDGKDKVLADLVIGKEVKDQPALRYVRRADRDQIYTVSIKTDKLSTKFEDWIEKDLLKLNTFDVREVELNDYSSQVGVSPQGRPVLELDKRALIKLAFDDAKSQWNLDELLEYADNSNEAKPAALAADEELDTQKLNDLKNALDDLQIVDVERKPTGLSQDLRASDEFLNNTEALQSLAERGFVPVPVGDQREIFSSEGEVTCTTKDGVRYVLRFGNLAGTSMPDADEKDADGKAKSAAPNRYLFVMAQFDESQIPKPEPVEEQKPADASSEEKKEPETKDAAGAAPKPVEAKPTDVKPAAKSVPEKKTADLQDDKAAPAETDAKAPVADSPKAEDAKPAEEKPADDKGADAKGDDKKEPAKPPTAEEVEKLAREKETKRRQDEYDAAVKRGQDKVKELNDRFADWYFIISDDVYRKIHLGRADVVKKKAADKKEGAADLNDLEDAIKIGPGAKDAPK
jgi:hypothetical protein